MPGRYAAWFVLKTPTGAAVFTREAARNLHNPPFVFISSHRTKELAQYHLRKFQEKEPK